MDAGTRNEEVAGNLEAIFNLIDEEELEEAKRKVRILQENLHGSIPELVHAQSLIDMLEVDLKEGDET